MSQKYIWQSTCSLLQWLTHLCWVDSATLTLWISHFPIEWVSGCFSLLPCFIEIPDSIQKSVYPDQTIHSAASDLGLHLLSVFLLWDARHKWINVQYFQIVFGNVSKNAVKICLLIFKLNLKRVKCLFTTVCYKVKVHWGLFCFSCNQKVEAMKRFTIHKPQNVMTIQLKR